MTDTTPATPAADPTAPVRGTWKALDRPQKFWLIRDGQEPLRIESVLKSETAKGQLDLIGGDGKPALTVRPTDMLTIAAKKPAKPRERSQKWTDTKRRELAEAVMAYAKAHADDPAGPGWSSVIETVSLAELAGDAPGKGLVGWSENPAGAIRRVKREFVDIQNARAAEQGWSEAQRDLADAS